MTLEHSPTSLVYRLAISSASLVPQGYYRSKLFIAPFSTNTLVAAAGPLLSLLERLCLSPSLPPIEHLRDNIEHEMRAFHSQLVSFKYSVDLTGIANYLLSATVDEMIGKNYLRVFGKAAEFKSFTPLTSDGAEPQKRFFEILNYLKERPNQYLDVLELIYFCLIAGFEGEHHLKPDGRQLLDNSTEDLYQIIKQHRFNKPHRLFTENPLPKILKKDYKKVIISAAIATTVLLCAFFSSHMVLEHKAKAVLYDHNQLVLLEQNG